jgi:preprotein translocase subunit SecE
VSESAGTTAATPSSRGGRGGSADQVDRRPNPIARIVLYVRQVVAELRKVIWPTRNELITYTSVVLVFVAVMMLIVSGFDFVFAKAVLAVFGK